MRMKHAFAAALIGFAASVAPAQAAGKDIVDTAVGAGDFKTLAAALEAADLVSTLKGEGVPSQSLHRRTRPSLSCPPVLSTTC